MTTVRKTVRFYQPVMIDQNGKRHEVTGDFWRKVRDKVNAAKPVDRECRFNFVDYFGQAHLARKPAIDYVYFGRIRPRADHPDGYRPNHGAIGPLQPAQAGDLISEPTYVVPIGSRNIIAVMRPTTGASRIQAIEAWLNHIVDMIDTPNVFTLRPFIDEGIYQRLMGAQGVTKLHVKVAPGTEVPSGLSGAIGQAIEAASEDTTDELSLEMTWSFGHRKGSQGMRSAMLNTAQAIARASGSWVEKAEVNMQVEDEEGDLRVEQHNLFEDRVAFTADFEVPDGEEPSEESVLTGIQGAIEEFRRRQL
jgi:hypothetical protein